MTKAKDFLLSAVTSNNINSTKEIIDWIIIRNQEVSVNLKKVAFKNLTNWKFSKEKGNLVHSTGKFFSIQGIRVNTNWNNIRSWDQPIIDQPEIGYLGFITKEFDGILHFLVQAKIEPGNVNKVQLSPTLQATKSNYTQVHKGKSPTYLEYFKDRVNNEVLLDQLQSEQGARFLKKRNRNIIIKVNSDIQLTADFKWVTLRQLKELMRMDNMVNMDTRTVLSGIPYGSYQSEIMEFYNTLSHNYNNIGSKMLISELDNERSLHSIDSIISWFTQLKTQYELNVDSIPLNEVDDWIITDDEIKHKDDKYFKVIGVDVEISNREVQKWSQPLIQPAQDGLCAFIVKEIDGVYHFLVQAKLECGNFDILEMAPSVQCLTGNYLNENSLSTLPFLNYVLNCDDNQILIDNLQSEEGGRFYHEQNRNLIILADEQFDETIPENYIWMTLNQLKSFIKFNNYLNIQARSLIAAISFN